MVVIILVSKFPKVELSNEEKAGALQTHIRLFKNPVVILTLVTLFCSTILSVEPQAALFGDVKFFDRRLKSSIFAHSVKTEPNLVLIGLNEVIYQQND